MKIKEVRNTIVRVFELAAVSATILAAHPVHAAIIGTTGQIERLETPLWLLDESSIPKTTSFLAFDEAQNVVLNQDIQISDPTNWDRLSDLDVIRKGTRVSSHFIFWKNPTPNQGLRQAQATVTFDKPIIGLMGDARLVLPTNSLFFPNDPGLIRFNTGLDEPPLPRDLATIVGNKSNILELDFKTYSGIDPLRVITLATPVPEPLTLLGTGTALGIAPLLKKAYSRKQKKHTKAKK